MRDEPCIAHKPLLPRCLIHSKIYLLTAYAVIRQIDVGFEHDVQPQPMRILYDVSNLVIACRDGVGIARNCRGCASRLCTLDDQRNPVDAKWRDQLREGSIRGW